MDFWKIFLTLLVFDLLVVGGIYYWWAPRKNDTSDEMQYKVAKRAYLIMQWKNVDPSTALRQARSEYRRGLL